MNGQNVLDVILRVSALIFVVGIIGLAWAIVYSRFLFGGYLAKKHRTFWLENTTAEKRLAAGRSTTDATHEIYTFRRFSAESFGDREVARRRYWANWFFSAAWTLILGGAGAAIGACVIFACLQVI
jgi:hypothetical protein